LIRTIEALNSLKLEDDEQIGVDIVKRALEEPLRRTQVTKEPRVGKVRESAKINFGFDAAKEEYGDRISARIVDPAKVTRSALQNAASIAAFISQPRRLSPNCRDRLLRL
jgi:chaperonin GroEL